MQTGPELKLRARVALSLADDAAPTPTTPPPGTTWEALRGERTAARSRGELHAAGATVGDKGRALTLAVAAEADRKNVAQGAGLVAALALHGVLHGVGPGDEGAVGEPLHARQTPVKCT